MKTLTQARRDRARDRARASIHRRHGAPPNLEHFKRQTTGRYTNTVKRLVYVMMLIPLAAFSTMSAMRLYDIGKEMHVSGDKILGIAQNELSGVDVVLGAEFAQIVFVVALTVLASNRLSSKIAFSVGIVLSTLIALVGNAQAGLWKEDLSAFRVLITLTPPVIVLLLGEVLALLWLDSVSAGHEAERLHGEALAAWSVFDRDPEKHPDWPRAFATAIRDELCRTNGITVDDRSADEWLVLVEVEINAEEWYAPQEFRRNPSERKERSERIRKGLVEFVEGNMSQAERVKQVLKDHPELIEVPRSEASERLGVGMSTLYRGIELYQQNGNSHHSDGE